MAVFFVAALIRVWLLRRLEERLLKNQAALEKQVADQQREVMAIRADSQQWRAEMKQDSDAFRAMTSEQLKAEERRFDELMKRCEHLQTSLDIARQMCAELPAAKARVLHLEQALGMNDGEAAAQSGGPSAAMGPRRQNFLAPLAAELPAVPSVDEERGGARDRTVSLGV